MIKEIEVGKRFTVKVPNGLAMNVRGNFAGQRVATIKITNSETIKAPSIDVRGQEAKILFDKSTPIGQQVEILVMENGPHIDSAFEQEVEASKAFTVEIKESNDSLYRYMNFSKALTFDQAYWTRGLGQIEIAKQLQGRENNELWRVYSLFAGVGFGGISALGLANGHSPNQLMEFWNSGLKKSLSQSTKVFGGKRSAKPVEKALRKFFIDKATGRDLLLKDMKAEVFIPIKDLNGRCLKICKESLPMMPIYQAAYLACIDPINFDSKPVLNGFTTMGPHISKNPDEFIRLSNQSIEIVSIGCPARMIDHGNKQATAENLAIILQDLKDSTELMNQVRGGLKRTRLECHPIDHIKRFDFSKKAIDAAINSAYGVL